MTVEYFRCWSDHTWDTDTIRIPDNTPRDDGALNAAVHKAADSIEWSDDGPPDFVGFYSTLEPKEPRFPADFPEFLDSLINPK